MKLYKKSEEWPTESDYLEEVEEVDDIGEAPKIKPKPSATHPPHPYLNQKEEEEMYVAYVTANPDLLREIYGEGGNNPVIWSVVGNEHCPPDILVHALNGSTMTAWYAAGNKSCPVDDLIAKLKTTKNQDLAWRISTNPAMPSNIKDMYAKHWANKKRK